MKRHPRVYVSIRDHKSARALLACYQRDARTVPLLYQYPGAQKAVISRIGHSLLSIHSFTLDVTMFRKRPRCSSHMLCALFCLHVFPMAPSKPLICVLLLGGSQRPCARSCQRGANSSVTSPSPRAHRFSWKISRNGVGPTASSPTTIRVISARRKPPSTSFSVMCPAQVKACSVAILPPSVNGVCRMSRSAGVCSVRSLLMPGSVWHQVASLYIVRVPLTPRRTKRTCVGSWIPTMPR